MSETVSFGPIGVMQQTARKKIEAIYPLSAMQKALVFHRLHARVDEGFLQVRFSLRGTLNSALFQRAWAEVTARHAALRTSIHWEGLEKPVQVVHPTAELPWTYQDWKARSPDEQNHQLSAFLETDRARGFDFTKPPMSRIALYRHGPEEHLLVWSCHHVLLDGWSAAVLLREVFLIYDALCQNRPIQLPPVPPYRLYLQWLERQDQDAVERFWKTELQGYTIPVLIADQFGNGRSNANRFDSTSLVLSTATTAALQRFVQSQRLTLNTLIAGLWALLLSQYGDRTDVVFGATVSGRTATIPGMEQMAGLFINVLPQRVRVDTERSLPDWLTEVQHHQVQRLPYEYVTLDQLLEWSGVPGHMPMFDSLLVFENFPWSELGGGDVMVRDFTGGFTTTYPLTIVIKPGPALTIQLIFDRNRVHTDRMTRIARDIEQVLKLIIADSDQPLAHILSHIEVLPTGANPSFKAPAYRPPRSELELRLTRIWEDVLGCSPVGIGDNFFDLGGHSLTALRLFARIEREVGKNLPLATLFEHPTIERLAGVLHDEAWSPPWHSLVPLRTGGSKPPLFCLHAGGGHVMFYRLLAEHLGPDQPVFGIQALGLNGTDVPLERIEAMASHYIDEIKRVQPEGPYHLVGRCFSNAIGIEMARQWQAHDQEVGLLVMLDSEPPPMQQPERPALIDKNLSYYLKRFIYHLRHARWSVIPSGLKEAIDVVALRIKHTRISQSDDVQARHLQQVMDGFNTATRHYIARPYAGKIMLIRSTEFMERPEKQGQTERWAELATGGIETYIISGRHDDLFDEPMVVQLAEHLKACLANVDEHR